jgi:transposase
MGPSVDDDNKGINRRTAMDGTATESQPTSTRSRKFAIRLTDQQRQELELITRNGQAPAKKITHARILLLADEDHPAGRYHDHQIAACLGVHRNTIHRLRRRFVLQGQQPALERKRRLTPPVPPKLDGRTEAHLVALCCSPPPEGRTCWTMQLLADELMGRGIVVSVGRETVRKTLKKTRCSPGGSSGSASPRGRALAS